MRELNPGQFARQHGVSRSRIIQLLELGRVRGARKEGTRWKIPEDAHIVSTWKPWAKIGKQEKVGTDNTRSH